MVGAVPTTPWRCSLGARQPVWGGLPGPLGLLRVEVEDANPRRWGASLPESHEFLVLGPCGQPWASWPRSPAASSSATSPPRSRTTCQHNDNNEPHAGPPAYHEAGHAVVAWRHGLGVLEIDMTSPAVALGPVSRAVIADGVGVTVAPGSTELVVPTVEADVRDSLLPQAEQHAQELLAGNLALRRRFPHVTIAEAIVHYGAGNYRRARNLALAFQEEDAARRWLNAQWRRACRLLREPGLWAAVEPLRLTAEPLGPHRRLARRGRHRQGVELP